MKNTLLLLTSLLIILNCNNQPQKKEPNQNENFTSNYAVIWNWKTTDPELVEENLRVISEEFTYLWEGNVIENAYFDLLPSTNKLGNFPNIAFFLQARSETEAESILSNLTLFKKGIATYSLHPVGVLWLGRRTEIIQEKGLTRSFAAVWTTRNVAEIPDESIQAQSNIILELWKQGIIENVYFDIEGTQAINTTTDFVFFVNANSREEAEEICNSLPFLKQNIATYELYQAGVFWLGKYEDQ